MADEHAAYTRTLDGGHGGPSGVNDDFSPPLTLPERELTESWRAG